MLVINDRLSYFRAYGLAQQLSESLLVVAADPLGQQGPLVGTVQTAMTVPQWPLRDYDWLFVSTTRQDCLSDVMQQLYGLSDWTPSSGAVASVGLFYAFQRSRLSRMWSYQGILKTL